MIVLNVKLHVCSFLLFYQFWLNKIQMTTINWQNYERSKLKLFFKNNDEVTVWEAGTFGQGQRYLEWIRKVSEWGANCSSSPPPNHCCAPYPLVHPTSIPLQFLSTFYSPLKEIGFKPWHKLAPQIDLILPHPGDISQKRRPTFFPPPFISACFLYLLLLPSMSCVLPFF